MKRKQLLIGNIIGAVLVLCIVVTGKISYSAIINSIAESISEVSAVGIIGAPHGPTSVFVSGNFNLNIVLLLLLPLLLVEILLILNVIYLNKNR